MIKIHSNVVIGSTSDLNQILTHVHYIINCSTNLNNLFVHPNYLNLNITQFSIGSLQILNSVYDFINSKIQLNQNIFILCENGIGNSLIVGMFLAMRLYKLNYNQVYYQIATKHSVNHYDFYSGLKHFEPQILNRDLDKMDTL
jgi:hypothetical protein